MLRVCITPPPLLLHPLLPAFYTVSGLHFAVSPLPIHRKPASSDPHQTSCKEVGPWKTSPERGGEKSGEGGPCWMGVVLCGGLAALASCRPPPRPHLPRWPTSAQHSHIFAGHARSVFIVASLIWQVFSTAVLAESLLAQITDVTMIEPHK